MKWLPLLGGGLNNSSYLNIIIFLSKFHWILVLGVQWLEAGIVWENGCGANWRRIIIWTNDDIIYWRTYALLDLNGSIDKIKMDVSRKLLNTVIWISLVNIQQISQ